MASIGGSGSKVYFNNNNKNIDNDNHNEVYLGTGYQVSCDIGGNPFDALITMVTQHHLRNCLQPQMPMKPLLHP